VLAIGVVGVAGVLLVPTVAATAGVVVVVVGLAVARGLAVAIAVVAGVGGGAVQHRLLVDGGGMVELCLVQEQQGPRPEERGKRTLHGHQRGDVEEARVEAAQTGEH
jgi:hypothetical protein